jgi:hypothetical protein
MAKPSTAGGWILSGAGISNRQQDSNSQPMVKHLDGYPLIGFHSWLAKSSCSRGVRRQQKKDFQLQPMKLHQNRALRPHPPEFSTG